MDTGRQTSARESSRGESKLFSEMTREDVLAWGRAMQEAHDRRVNSPEYRAKVERMRERSNASFAKYRRLLESGEQIPKWD